VEDGFVETGCVSTKLNTSLFTALSIRFILRLRQVWLIENVMTYAAIEKDRNESIVTADR
jgi:hypothetical protein